jgi:hypothetical protein
VAKLGEDPEQVQNELQLQYLLFQEHSVCLEIYPNELQAADSKFSNNLNKFWGIETRK